MESLALLVVLILLAGPVLAVIALVKISNLETAIRRLKKDLEARPMLAESALAPAPPTKTNVPKPEQVAEAISTASPEVAAPKQADPKQQPAAVPRDMEKALASRWFVWAGGIAVALGGLLFVKYAHDAGLIPPLARVIIGLFAAAVLAYAGEWTRNRNEQLAKSYIPAALSASGLVIAFGVLYAAHALYGILTPAVAFPLLVAVGLAALWLSRRQGPLIAALGLLGALIAPMLVPSDNPSAVGFFAYLAVLLSACLYELRDRPWWWLGYAAIGGAGLWALFWINGFGAAPLWPIAAFGLFLGAAATLIPCGKGILAAEMGSLAQPAAMAHPMRIAVAGMAVGAVVLGTMTWTSGHATPALLVFAFAMASIATFGWLRDGMVGAPLAAALGTLILFSIWKDVGFHEMALDERGFWVTVPGLVEPPRYRNAMLVAMGAFTALGLAGVQLKHEKRSWAALAAASAFLFLFAAWVRADFTWSNMRWAIMALLLAAVLKYAVWRWRGRVADKSIGWSVDILVGGIVALLLFAADRLLDGVWLTLSVAVLAAALAYTVRSIPSANIAAMAAAVASFAALRLFIGREFWGEPTGVPWGPHWVLYGYGIPAALFWWASRQLNPEAFARYRIAFEGLALGLAVSLVSLELRVLIAGGITRESIGLLEVAAHAMTWLGAAFGLAYRQQIFSSFVSLWGARVLLAASCLAFLACLTGRNPVITTDMVEGNAAFNSLLLAYLAPVPVLALFARKLDGLGLAKLRGALGAFALALLLAYVTLQTKRLFQDATIDIAFLSQAESYAVSLVWVATGILIFIAGLRLDRQTIRYGGLAVLVLAVLKVFAYDLFELGGLWRIASIIGLGLCLIGVGWLYTRFIQKPKTSSS
jgi:uncharacterized membrane protein